MNAGSTNYTAQNQTVLLKYSEQIAKDFNVQPKEESSGLWNLVSSYFPTFGETGRSIGQNLALTYGQEWSNKTIDLVVGKIFQEEVKKIPAWSWEALKHRVSGAAQQSLSQGLQLAITPKALPILTIFSGVTGQITLPLVVNLVSFVYQKTLGNPEVVNKLGELPLEQLFSIDPETHRLRDGAGHLMTYQEMRMIFEGTAEYNLIGKLIELCHVIDKKPDEEIESTAKNLIKTLVKTYCIKRSDGSVAFPDGSVRTAEEKQTIKDGIAKLAMKNYRHDNKEIEALVRVLARHSIAPFENLSLADLNQLGSSKKMASVFTDENDEWKNNIIRGSDGQYFVLVDCGNKKRGDIVSADEMEQILWEAEGIKNQLKHARKLECQALIKDPSQYSVLVEKLNQVDASEVKEFLSEYLVKRELDGAMFHLDGTSVQDPDVLIKKLDDIPKRSQLKERTKVIEDLVRTCSKSSIG
ncbi:MAG: hypothetical protein H0V82_00715 [Candidatus Protochlamydia sp.]|nr:hypothetical protein [Candidatus Protochlamydia sp.]